MSAVVLGTAPKFFDTRWLGLSSWCSVRRGCSSRGIVRAGRDAASRESVDANRRPGGARATPPSRHYERDLRMQQCETEGHRSCATPNGIAKAGPGPINRRGGAPRGERPPAAQIAKADLRGDARASDLALRAYVTGPRRVPRKHPSACRRSAPSHG